MNDQFIAHLKGRKSDNNVVNVSKDKLTCLKFGNGLQQFHNRQFYSGGQIAIAIDSE